MFTSARIKLTLWYLLIIMSVSLAFSFVVYRMLDLEVNRFAAAQKVRLERRWLRPPGMPQTQNIIDPDLVIEIHQRIIFMLAMVNLGILVVSGVTGYFLAGRTLSPIQTMVSEQNRFISDASHELRTPLTSLRAAMEVFLREKSPKISDAKILINESLSDVQKLQSLSESLMQLAQFQKPQDKLQFQNHDLSQIITESIKKISPLANKKQISINYSAKKLKIFGDKYSLTDLFVILLDNAIKYSPQKSQVEIHTASKNNSLIIEIVDQGIGISKKDINKIFDRFYRADSARSNTSFNGFGLGLSIAKKIVESHKGTITVSSVPNSGSTFTIKI